MARRNAPAQNRSCPGPPAGGASRRLRLDVTRDFADGQTFLDPTFNGEHIAPVGNANVSQLNAPSVNAAIKKAHGR